MANAKKNAKELAADLVAWKFPAEVVDVAGRPMVRGVPIKVWTEREKGRWVLPEGEEGLVPPDRVNVFVHRGAGKPVFYLVPQHVVAAAISSKVRLFAPDPEYRDRWDLLGRREP